ncbi:GNAT family N-acetyltransferase [Virgibacillus oceani]|uniref:GCN5 family N-acetyltransferase n=1 Tax=Virgibacillus oceani TaxID=1479511 RepID=A0A917M6H1_9BACI|nr:GNAT family N-acetyltransferase [Virgibacillus oceani]GGG80481.1 GCN5 family N-acetyltransferase [Virgibacillus oceani]
MKVDLRIVTRDNWEEALSLKVGKQQQGFVPTPAVSLAKVYIKPDGEGVEYIPFAIYVNDLMVGFLMHAYEEITTDSYWINGFIIDEKYQGRGYGKCAMIEMIKWIQNRFPQCEEVRLTVFPDNYVAKNLYKSQGFEATGQIFGGEEVFKLVLEKTHKVI